VGYANKVRLRGLLSLDLCNGGHDLKERQSAKADFVYVARQFIVRVVLSKASYSFPLPYLRGSTRRSLVTRHFPYILVDPLRDIFQPLDPQRRFP
jgi:hypothetical protein